MTINFQSDNDNGEVCCVVLNEYSQSQYTDNNNLKPSCEQVKLGLDANNADAVSDKCVDASDGTTKTTSMSLDGLSRGTSYSAFCCADNGALVWPSYTTYASASDFDPVNFTTNGEADEDDDDDDSALLASSNLVAVFLMIAALIFN